MATTSTSSHDTDSNTNSLVNKFKALVLVDKDTVKYEDVTYDFENLDKDHLVIKVASSGLGPYDLGLVSGKINLPNFNTTFGIEGTGVVVKLGSNCDKNLMGKRVAFISSMYDPHGLRALSEFAVVTQELVVELNEKISDDQGAYLIANPATAIGLYETMIKGHSAILQDTASSALGKMVTKIAKKNNIKIINIVRKDENIQILNDIGSNYTFNSKSTTFWKDLTKAIEELNPTLYLSYQGGFLPSQIFDKMPKNTVMCTCGNINNENLTGFSSTDFIFKGKTIVGFTLFNYFAKLNKEQMQSLIKSIVDDVSNEDGNSALNTDIQKVFKFEQWEEAKKFYEENMSKGKIVFHS